MSLKSFLKKTQLLLEQSMYESRRAMSSSEDSLMRLPEVTQLEERVLMSASPVAVLPDVAEATTDAAQGAPLTDQQLLDFVADEVLPASESISAEASESSNEQQTTELVFIDANVSDVDRLIASLQAEDQQDDSRTLEYVVLDASRNGLAQITETLVTHDSVDGIHIVSHGSDGRVQLGNTTLSMDNIDTYRSTFAAWRGTMSADADLLFYGCDLAATAYGRELMNQISAACDCDVAASEDLTGHESLGGDWDLEYHAGEIETEIAFGDELFQTWQYVLASPSDITTTQSTEGGVSLNEDGGNDAYLLADDGGALLGGLTTVTVEASFSMATPSSAIGLVSYAEGSNDEALGLFINNSGQILFTADSSGTAQTSTSGYTQLFDGDVHHVAVTWDNAAGNVQFFVDGQLAESASGYQTGSTIGGGGTLVFGNDQDSVGGGFDPNQAFEGTLHDVRIFDDVRTATEIESNYRSTLPYHESGMIANWTFSDLSTDDVITDTVSGNNLTVSHAAGGGFVASTATLTTSINENSAAGTVVGTVAGHDAERTAEISSLLLADTNLRHNAETGKFYKVVASSVDWTAAKTAAESATLNGVTGQLATIRSANENAAVTTLAATVGGSVWLGGTDQTTEGDWRWIESGAEADQFWLGDETGRRVGNVYQNWVSGSQPNDVGGGEDAARLDSSDGRWYDAPTTGHSHYYMIEWHADAVLDVNQALTYSIQSQTVSGAFAVDSDGGQITVADGTLLDYETNTAHTLTVRVTDVDSNTRDRIFNVSLNDLAETEPAPVDLSHGIELNTDGGNDAYLVTTSGGDILGGLSEFTVEVAFSTTESLEGAPLISYATSSNSNTVSVDIESSSAVDIWVGGSNVSAAVDLTGLNDGEVHSVAFSWDNTAGDWKLVVDGQLRAAGTGVYVGSTLATGGTLVYGQEQDSVGGSFETSEVFSGTLHDVRIWDSVRSMAEIAANYQQKLDTSSLPSNLIANWQMTGFNGSSEVVDVVSARNLSIGHAGGAGFSNSTPIATLNVNEGAVNGTSVGLVRPTDADSQENLVTDSRFLDSGDTVYTEYTSGQTFGGWTVESGDIGVEAGFADTSPLGGLAIDMNGTGPGAISQTFTTEVGREYQVSFALSGNFFVTTSKELRVSAGGTSQDYTIDNPTGWATTDLKWEHRTFSFVADSTSTTLMFESISTSGGAGAIISDVQAAAVPTAVSSLLKADSTLSYNAITGKFYRLVNSSSTWSAAQSAAIASTLNGASGQLVTIETWYEDDVIHELASAADTDVWLGASDQNSEGDWYWYNGTAEGTQFWSGAAAGSAQNGAYTNWDPAEPDNAGSSEHFAYMATDGTWNDSTAVATRSYVIEWDAADVVEDYSYTLTNDAGGRFAIDNTTGEITVADGSLLDYESNASHSVTARVTDAAGNTYDEVLTINVNNLGGEPTQSLPGAQSTNEDIALTFSSGASNAITVSDTGAADTELQVSLSVTNGVLKLSQLTGITIVDGADDSAAMTINGTESAINAALEGMTYTPTGDYSGSANLQVTTSLGADLSGYYTFDAGTAADDSAGTAQDGTLLNDATTVTDGTRGEVLSLDGDGDAVQISGRFSDPADVTLAAWVNLSSADTGGSHVISLGDSVLLTIDEPNAGNGVSGVYYNGSTWVQVTSGEFIAGTGWHHVAFSFDDTGNTATLYLDGVEVSTTSTADSISYTQGANTLIGVHGNGNSAYDFNGTIDDARIYGRAISADEVAALAADNTSTTDNVSITVNPVNDVPTLTSFGAVVDTTNEDTEVEISLSDLAAQGNEADIDGTVTGFVVKSVTTGTLKIGTSAGTATAWAAGTNDTVDASNNAYWTPASDVNGTQNAFAVVAEDNQGAESASNITVQVSVTAVNDAPVLDNSGSMSLTTITEDETSNGGNLVSAIISSAGGDRITDADSGADEGIAVVGLTSSNGTWQYNTGSGWTNVGSVSTASSLLLRASDSLRFVPDAIDSDTAFVTFAAWDQTSGTAGTKVDTSVFGGSTPFSATVETASIIVTAVNDRPTLTSFTAVVDTTNEETEVEVTLAELAAQGNEADVDGSVTAFVVKSVPVGTLKIGTSSGAATAWAAGTNDTIDATNHAYWTPANNSTGTQNAFTVVAEDNLGLESIGNITSQVSVTSVNDAPVLNNTPAVSLDSQPEDDGTPGIGEGTLVSDLIDESGGGGYDNVFDVDTGSVTGIAITAADTTHGQWWVTTDGGNIWNALGSVTDSNARLLAANASTYVFFEAHDNYNGTITNAITFRAWDQTSGTNGGGADTTTNGTTTAFSTATETADITISAVNDAPVFVGATLVTNGTFDADLSNWAPADNVDWSGGEVRFGTVGGANGSLTQVITTSIGATYYVSFDYGDRSGTQSQSLQVQADGAATLLVADITTGVASNTLEEYKYSFVADSTSTTLTFTDTSVSHSGVRGYLDNIRMAAAATPPVDLSYSEGDGAVAVDVSVTLTDIDHADIDSAVIQITGNYANGEDVLTFVDTVNISGTWTVGTGTLSLSGSDTLANYQAALRSITYTNNSEDPSALTRTVSFTVSDGSLNSVALTRDISFSAVNDAPVVTAPTGPLAATEQIWMNFEGAGFSVADSDDSGAAMTATLTATQGAVSVTVGDSGVSIVSGNGSGSVVLSGTETQLNALLGGTGTGTLEYRHPSNSPPASTTLTLTVNDEGNTGTDPGLTGDGSSEEGSDSVTVNITAVNDAPGLTSFAAVIDTTTEDTEVELTLAELKAQGNESDSDGTVDAFVVKSVTTGTLKIGANAGAATAWAAGTNDTIDATNHAYWTPDNDVTGTQNAFAVVAEDDLGAESTGNVTAQVSVSDVNDIPTLTTFAAVVDTTAEDTEVEVTFAELAAQGDEADSDGTVTGFVVQSITTGTLKIGANAGAATAWAAGTNDTIDGSNHAYWTPANNANGTQNAFQVVAEDDDGGESASNVTVQVSVSDVNDIPTLTTFAAIVDTTAEDTEVEVTFAELATQGDEADSDGTVTGFVVQSITTGTLKIGANAGAATAWAAGTNDTIDATNHAYWTPANNANGTQNAFQVVAEDDDGGESASNVTVQVSVSDVNDIPTLTTFAAAVDTTNEDTEVEVTFAELAAQGDEADSDGTVTGFVVQSITTGTLKIGANAGAATAWAAGTNDTIDGSNHAYWTPANNANGTQNAFQVVAEDDDGGESASNVTVQVPVSDVNDIPTLTAFVAVVDATAEDTEVELTFAELAVQGDEADSDGSVTGFVVQSITTGTLKIGANAGAATAWAAGTNDTIDATNHAYWTPANGANGTQNAFQVVAEDDDGGESASNITVQVSVSDVNDIPTLTTFAAVVDTTAEDTEVELTFAELAAQGDEADVDGSVTGFVVQSITTGTLKIGANAGAATAWAAGTNDTIDATNHAYWTPANSVNGTQNAFQVVAEDDDGGESASNVTVQVSVSDVNDIPTLTTFAAVVDTTAEDTEVELTFAELAAQGDEADSDGTITAFVVNSVTTGTLKIGANAGAATAWAAGTNDTIDGSNHAYWTPANNANGTQNAFQVVAEDDDGGESASNVTVQVSVSDVNDIPTLTTFAAVVDTTAEDTEVELTFAELAAQGDEADVDGSVAGFVVQSITTGTLKIGANAGAATAWAAGTNDTIDATNHAYWTPANGANGTQNAFQVVAEDDDGGESASNITVQVSVSDVNDIPTLTTFAAIVDTTAEDTEVEVTFAELAAQGDEADSDGTVTAFVVNSVTTGTLKIGANAGAATAWAAGTNDTIDGSNHAYWTPANNANGTQNAFQVVAEDDDGGESASNVTVQVSVSDVNDIPTLTTFAAVVDTTAEDTEVEVTFAELAAQGDEADSDGTVIAFVVNSVTTGTLKIGANAGAATAWAAGTNDTIDATNHAYWTPANNVNGTQNAFQVVAEDDDGGESASNVTVQVSVSDVNDIPTLTTFAAIVDTTTEDTEVEVTFAELAAQGDEADSDGTVTGFVVQSITTGTLKIGANAGAATAWAAGTNDTIDGSNHAYWTPANDANGTQNVFQVVAEDDDGGESASNVTVQVSVSDVNDIPTLTTFAAVVDTTTEDTEVEVTFAELAAQGDETDSDGTVTGFVVQNITTGTLKIGVNAGAATAWAAGTNDTIDGSNHAYWTPANNANGTQNAFQVVAEDDDGAESASNVTVQVSVSDVNDIPTLTTFATIVDTTTEDTEVEVTFAELAAQGDEADSDGTVTGFVVQSITSGTLKIGANAGAATAWAAGTNDTIDGSNYAYWTPANNANGTQNAFQVVAEDDDGGESASNVTVQVSVSDVNDIPTLTTFAAVVDTTAEDTEVAVTFAELAAQGNEADSDGTVTGFVVQSITTGTLRIGANAGAATAWAAGTNDTIDATNHAYWTPANNANGTQNAFEVVAEDDDAGESASNVTVQVSVSDVNDIPTLTTFATIVDTTAEDTEVEVTFAELAAQGNEADSDGTVTAFVVNSVTTGTLKIGANAGAATAWAAGTNDTIDATNHAYWTPANNANGTQNAFQVVAEDDDGGESASNVTVQVSVSDVNDIPTLTTFAAVVDTTNEDTEVEVTFAELAAQGDEADSDGTVSAFVVNSVTTGTLRIGASAGVATAWTAGSNDTIDASNHAYWTPTNNANGIQNAFQVVAEDDDNAESASNVTVQASVSDVNDIPTLTTFAAVVDTTNEDTQVEVTFAELAAQGDEGDVDGSVTGFVVKSVDTGTLLIGTNAGTATVWAAGTNDTIDATNNAYWTAINDANGTQSAFSVVAEDDDAAESLTTTATQIFVTADNDVPVIGTNSLAILEGGTVVISSAELSATDVDNTDSGLIFNVSNITAGQFEFSSAPTVAITSFTQSQVTSGAVVFIHDGSETVPTYDVTVNDGSLTSPVSSASLTFTHINDEEVLFRNSGITVLEGDTGIAITRFMLETTDVDHTAAQLQYTVTAIPSATVGTLRLNGTALINGNTFTQEDINLGRLTYDHLGVEVFTDGFDFTVDDGIGSITNDTFAISIFPSNDNSPIITSDGGAALATLSVTENQTAVTTVTATDSDLPVQTMTYSIVGGADMGRFAIGSGTGVLTFASAPDFEAATDANGDNTYEVVVLVSDGQGLTDQQTIQVTVTDVDESNVSAISDADTASDNVAENSSVGASVGITALATDSDGTDTVSYTLDDSAGGRFAIDSSRGVVTVAATLDREADAVHTITVRATSTDSSTTTRSYTINVQDVDEFDTTAVSDTNITADVIDENVSVGTTVGITAFSEDLDATTNAITYSLDDSAGGLFAIDAGTGVVTTASSINYESVGSSLSITVRATSADGSSATQTYSVTVNDQDEFDVSPIVDNNVTPNTIDENVVIGTAVGITAFSEDLDGTTNAVTYSLDDSAGGLFTIDSNTGLVTTASTIDYESVGGSLNIVVRATSADSSTTSQAYTITVNDLNDNAPVVTMSQSFTVLEHAPVGTSVGIALASDVDTVGALQGWTIASGNSDGIFAINSNTGEITIADTTNLNHESTSVHNLSLTVSDGSHISVQEAVSITVVDENDAPVFAPATAATTDENSSNGTFVSFIAATDEDIADVLTYSIVSGTPGQPFAIDSASGAITVSDSSQLNFEATTGFSLQVQVSDVAGLIDTQLITIHLNDVNETPTDISISGGFVPENSATGAVVGTVTGSDVDAGDSLTYLLTDDSGGRFSIASVTGQITVADGSLLNFEAASSHGITVRATDAGGLTYDESFTIAVTDVNEAPQAGDDAVVAEQLTELVVGAGVITANDSDIDGDAISVVLITGPTHGSLTLNADGSFAYMPTGSYAGTDQFTYFVTDGFLNSLPASVVINIETTVSAPATGSSDDGNHDDGLPEVPMSTPDLEVSAEETHEHSAESNEHNESTETTANAIIPDSVAGVEESVEGLMVADASHELLRRTSSEAFVAVFLDELPQSELLADDARTSRHRDDRDSSDGRGERQFLFAQVTTANPLFGRTSFDTDSGVFVQHNERTPLHDFVMDKVVVGTTAAVSTSVSVGYLVWMLRSGSLLTTLLSSLPAWQAFDPLPILDTFDDSGAEDDDDSLLSIVS